MRRYVAIVMLCVVALSWAVPLAARPTLPPCCKAHGCTMMKGVAHGCAFSRCDRHENATDAKQLPAVVVDESRLPRVRSGWQPVLLTQSCASTVAGRSVDHPPRLRG